VHVGEVWVGLNGALQGATVKCTLRLNAYFTRVCQKVLSLTYVQKRYIDEQYIYL